jgi:hypothetical protein
MLRVSQPAFDIHVSTEHRVLVPAACAGRCGGALSSCTAATPASATAAPRLSPFCILLPLQLLRLFRASLSLQLLCLPLLRLGTLLLILFLILKFQLYLGFGGLLPSLLCVALFPSAPVSATSSLLMFLPCTSVEPCGCCLSLYLGSR